MDITRTAISKSRVTYTILAIVLASGFMSYQSMPRSQDPGFIIRTAMIQTFFPGASPERVEKLVTDPLEKAIQEIPELDTVSSTSKTGVSIIFVDIKESETEMRPIWDNLRRKVERETPNLPEGIRGPYVNDEFGDVFGIIVSIMGDGFSYAELKDVADQARDELLLLDNVAKVDVVGDQEERIFLEYDNARLARLNLTPYEFQQILSSQNILTPGGSIRVDEERIFLEPTGNFESVDEISSSIITLPGRSEVIYLRDMVKVTRGYIDPPNREMYSSGEIALGLAVSMRDGGNIIDLGNEVKAAVRRLEGAYPIGIQFDVVAFEPAEVDKTIRNFSNSLLQSVGVVIITMVLFLGVRTGLVVATLIPATILASFLLMAFFDIGLDQISLAALIISLGLLVDNAIVMSESCMVQMAGGVKPIEAAVRSASELKIPLLTSSLTTSAAFLPIFLAESATGEYTASLFKVVTIALLCSWLMALTLIPMLCAVYLKVKQREGEAYNSAFYHFYRKILMLGLRFPLLALVLAYGTFFVSLQGFNYIPKSFFPDSDQPMLTAKMELPTGTAIEETSRVVRRIDNFIKEKLKAGDGKDGVTNWATFVGEGAPRFILTYAPDPPTPGLAYWIINVNDYRVSRQMIDDLAAFVRENFPDALFNAQPLAKGPPVTNPIEVRISGRETEQLFELVANVKEELKRIPGTINIDDNWGPRAKKMMVRVNQARARRAGLSSQDIAISLQTILSGLETTQFREDDKTIPIVLRSSLSDRQDFSKLEQLTVYAQATGTAVPLRQIADIEVVWEAPLIKRRNRLRTVMVLCKLVPGVTATEVENQLKPSLEAMAAELPPGYRFELGGENESSSESQESIGVKLPIAGMIIILLLVGQFNSFRRPIIIMATLPLGIIGVVIGMLITQAQLGFMAFLGIISLMGIVINNAIVLIDRIKLEIAENGHAPPRAIIEASQRRLRPILLTTVTTLAGLVPLWTGGGPMFEPMAITIIFGLAFATFLTLGVVPVLYSIFFRVQFKGYDYDKEVTEAKQ
ncbi:MAG: efflux RND transporter permease subunit [Acidobacteriota bacterium]|nr:efflux RND transporter permease subunit [Acidobacteriota bacterium]